MSQFACVEVFTCFCELCSPQTCNACQGCGLSCSSNFIIKFIIGICIASVLSAVAWMLFSAVTITNTASIPLPIVKCKELCGEEYRNFNWDKQKCCLTVSPSNCKQKVICKSQMEKQADQYFLIAYIVGGLMSFFSLFFCIIYQCSKQKQPKKQNLSQELISIPKLK